MAKRYDVCVPRKYVTREGEAKTHFWNVGTAFPMRERDGISVKLWTRILPADELVLFLHEPRPASGGAAPPEPEPVDDDIPF